MFWRVSILVVSALAVFTGLSEASAAPAANADYAPQLTVSSHGSPAGYDIDAQVPTNETTATGRLSLYVPPKFKTSFPTTGGAVVGGATVRLQLADQNNVYTNLTGSVVVASNATLACAAANSPTPMATFSINVSGNGLTLSIPMAVYPITGTDTKYSSYEFTQCLPPPGVPQGTAGRAPEGGRFVGETLTMPSAILSGPPNATSVWASGWTPFSAGTATLDESGSAAAQSVSGAPGFLLHSKTTVKTSTQNGNQVKKTYVTLSGLVTRGQLGAIKASVNVYYGSKPDKLVSTRWQSTNIEGAFSYQTQVSPPYRYFQADARLPARFFPSSLCQPMIPTYPCAEISAAPALALSNVVRVNASS
jgi:hypothetical protein